MDFILFFNNIFIYYVGINKLYFKISSKVPLNIDQIDYNFSYIFEEKSLMTVWHGEGANNFKRGMSESLAKIIVQEDEKPILIIGAL